MARVRAKVASERGQTIVEFALMAPVIFLLLFGIIDFGMALNHRITLEHAVREGARFAAVTTDCAAIQQRTAERAGTIISQDEVTVSYHEPDGADITTAATAGDEVRVSAPFEWEFPLMSALEAIIDVHVGPIDSEVWGSAVLERAVTDAGGCSPPP